MRLLNTSTASKDELKLEEFGSNEIPLYSILSHTWGENEITFQDIGGADLEKRRDMKRSGKPAPRLRQTDSIMFGSTLAAHRNVGSGEITYKT
jgi:hypothetical protein